MSLERTPQLGTRAVTLSVKLPSTATPDCLSDGLRDLYRKGDFTDVVLQCVGQTFLAHRAILASQSIVFKQGLSGTDKVNGREEIRMADIANPEAIKIMLDFMYQIDADKEYNPRTQEINKDVLRLAQNFQLPQLTERATYWLAKDVTTGNVIERLAICEEFACHQLREKILEQLAYNRLALLEVAHSPQILNHPKFMLELLQQVVVEQVVVEQACTAAGIVAPQQAAGMMSEPVKGTPPPPVAAVVTTERPEPLANKRKFRKIGA